MEIVVSFAVGMLVLCIIMKLISLPFKLMWKLISNSIIGAIMLAVVNVFGVGIEITFIKALIAGFFGIPGVIAIVILHFL